MAATEPLPLDSLTDGEREALNEAWQLAVNALDNNQE